MPKHPGGIVILTAARQAPKADPAAKIQEAGPSRRDPSVPKLVCKYYAFRDVELGGVVASSDEEGATSRRRQLREPLGPNERCGCCHSELRAA